MTTVVTVYPQAGPEEVMREVTVPVEDAIASVPGLDHINSTSVEGMTFTLAMFEYGTDMNDVNNIIRQNLSELDLPPEVLDVPNAMPQVAENPQLIPLNISNMPVVTFSFGGDMNLRDLEHIAAAEIVPGLEAIDGTYNVLVDGGGEEMVIVNMDPGKLIEFGISVSQVAGILALGEYDSLDEVENAVLSDDVLLGDVAMVDLSPSPGTAITRTNGQPSLTIAVMKDADANTVSVANAVVYEAEKIAETLGSGLELVTVFDQSDFIENSISDLTRNALVGTVLAVIVVFLFLMAFRASLVTAVSIPLSLLIGFLAMRGWGLTINLLTLSAMVIAVGRAIDNSIVVLEVMFRRMKGGETFGDAALNGVREIATPITAATVATVVIFIPLALVGGIVGEMFVPFALTITFTLVASLLVALMIVPPLSNFTKSIKSEAGVRETWYQGMYARILQWSLGHRGVILIVATILFFGSFALIPLIGTSFIPATG
jgi:HAE1 family hydrophobic/amphiphilic exporter-1